MTDQCTRVAQLAPPLQDYSELSWRSLRDAHSALIRLVEFSGTAIHDPALDAAATYLHKLAINHAIDHMHAIEEVAEKKLATSPEDERYRNAVLGIAPVILAGIERLIKQRRTIVDKLDSLDCGDASNIDDATNKEIAALTAQWSKIDGQIASTPATSFHELAMKAQAMLVCDDLYGNQMIESVQEDASRLLLENGQ